MAKQERKNAQQEAQIMKALNHQNIIQFKDVFNFKDNRFRMNLVMEYADGGKLSEMILRRK